MSPRSRNTLGLLFVIALGAACSASSGGNIFGSSSTGSGEGGQGQGSGTGPGSGTGAGDVGGGFNITTGSGGSTGSGTTCNHDPNADGDGDGWTTNEGDCNDCDANVNPGAIEVTAPAGADGGVPMPADEDCDGVVDNVLPTCDDGLALDDPDPNDGARAVDLCQFTTANPVDKKDKKWGVLSAAYVRADGTASPPPVAAQYGLQPGFGSNVHAQGGSRILALSSGYARTPGQPGACGSLSCYNNYGGNAPPGFPQDVPNCSGDTNINDDVALELHIRTPTNATGYSFDFDFYSFEYPEWVCTSFNDQFIALVSPSPMGSINGNISFDSQHNPVSVNIAFFNVCQGCSLGTSQLQGTGFDVWNDAGATSWLKSQAPVKGGDEITVRFAIWDTGDQAWDSTALVDNWQWIANGGTVTVSTDPIPTPK